VAVVVVTVVATVIAIIVAAIVVVAIARRVLVGVPVFAHEVDIAAASIVFAAVFGPVLGVAWRNAQVQWLSDDASWTLDDHWLRIQHWWRGGIADINAAEKAWLANSDGNAYVLSESRSAECQRGGG